MHKFGRPASKCNIKCILIRYGETLHRQDDVGKKSPPAIV